jgi:hypothetical protein
MEDLEYKLMENYTCTIQMENYTIQTFDMPYVFPSIFIPLKEFYGFFQS